MAVSAYYLRLTLLNRACIGRGLAMMQLHIILATIFRRYDFVLQSDAPVCLDGYLLGTLAEARFLLAPSARQARP